MASNRDEFLEKTKKVLQERTGNRCSNPDCRCSTSGPNHHPEKATRIGVAAHITAAAENGPRYDPYLSPEERRSILNGIWLCQNCSKLIDSDPILYTENLLQRWKSHTEELARIGLEGGELKPEQIYEGYFCPHCDTFSKEGVTVCLGCDSDIYYGSTPTQWKQDVQAGMSYALVGCFILFAFTPKFINDWLETSIPIFWGINILGILIFGFIACFGTGIWNARNNERKRKAQPPVFIRKRH